jgi:hypothetical protein
VAAERLQQRAGVGPQPCGAVCCACSQADALPHAAGLRVRVPRQPCSGASRESAPADEDQVSRQLVSYAQMPAVKSGLLLECITSMISASKQRLWSHCWQAWAGSSTVAKSA